MENKNYDHDLDWYKHEYYAECDRAEKLEKALDECIDFIIKEDCSEQAERYKPNYYLGCENCNYRKMCGVVLHGNKKRLKEWLLRDEKE